MFVGCFGGDFEECFRTVFDQFYWIIGNVFGLFSGCVMGALGMLCE